MALKFGLFVPPFGGLAEPGRLVELARAADGSGWDGFFLWDHILALPGMAVADPWVTMAALAQSTTSLRLGTLVTPLARRRPWVLARQAATLDRLSGGRLVVGVGLGDDSIGEFSSFRGEASDPVQRGAMLDESLELLRWFWSGQDVAWEGQYFSVHSGPFLPRPAQALTRLGGLSVASPPSAGPGGPAPGLLPAVRPRRVGHPRLPRPGGRLGRTVPAEGVRGGRGHRHRLPGGLYYRRGGRAHRPAGRARSRRHDLVA